MSNKCKLTREFDTGDIVILRTQKKGQGIPKIVF